MYDEQQRLQDLKQEATKLYQTPVYKILCAILQDVRTKPAQYVLETTDATLQQAHRLDSENIIIKSILDYFDPNN
jgi:hypothetical protein